MSEIRSKNAWKFRRLWLILCESKCLEFKPLADLHPRFLQGVQPLEDGLFWLTSSLTYLTVRSKFSLFCCLRQGIIDSDWSRRPTPGENLIAQSDKSDWMSAKRVHPPGVGPLLKSVGVGEGQVMQILASSQLFSFFWVYLVSRPDKIWWGR